MHVVRGLVVLMLLIMVALRSRCEHYIFAMWFLSSFIWSQYGMEQSITLFILWFFLSFFFFFFSSPNLSPRRLDVCHTSTHGEALV